MKFIVLFVLAMAPGYVRNISGEPAPVIFKSRPQCEAAIDWTAYRMNHQKVFHAVQGMWAYACIQIDGPVPRFPVIEQIAEGWERA